MNRLLLLVLSVGVVHGYQHYQQQIPNGDRVPDPSTGGIWSGVGHENSQGRGARNPFGKDFAANNHVWDATLCRKDSDSDGKTNGQELGDPNCVWSKGDTPASTTGLSHPGVCEPINSVECQGVNSGVDFEAGAPFDCPATSTSDVTATTYRFPSTQVPSSVTSYYCKYFPIQLGSGQSQHMIAYEPVIDNTEIMHHTLVYGCLGDTVMDDGVVDCDDGMSECNELLMVWAVGINGVCYPEIYGTMLGEGGFTGIWMEHHWNNPQQASGLYDSSGMKVYHTPSIRANEARYVIWGPMMFMLEPGQSEENVAGECPADRTQYMTPESVNIAEIIPHMHYLGKKMVIKHKGETVLTDDSYEYDSPKVFTFDTPLKFSRGDDIQIHCTFDTTGQSERTFYGPATNDEMCFMVALIYPFDSSIPTFCGRSISAATARDVPGMSLMLTLALAALLKL